MMNAIYIDEQGTEGNMVYGEVEEPEFGPTDILVRTKAAVSYTHLTLPTILLV